MPTAKIINMASAIFNRMKLAAQAGITFEGSRDLYAKLGYKRALSFADYWDRYLRGGIAARVVDAYPQATWRNAPILHEKGKQDDASEFKDTFDTLQRRLSLFHYLERADRLSGVGSYGILLLGVAQSGQLEDPVKKLSGPDDIIYLSTYTETNAQILGLVNDTTDPRFALPESYNVSIFAETNVSSEVTTAAQNKIVHHSRTIHFAEGLNEDEVFGRPRMERVWNYLDDLDKIAGGGSEAVWLTVDRGIQFDIDKDAQLDDRDKDDFADEIDEYMHGMRRFLKTQGVKANVLGSDVPDPRGAFFVTTSLISGTTGIPTRVLFGSERGQLASTQDERNFNGRVKERQQHYAEPKILRPLVDKLVTLGALPEVEYTVEWPDTSTMTLKESADVAARAAQAIRNISAQTKEGKEIITPGEFREKFLGMPREKDAAD